MANDYNGYIATYREYQRGDHYRKALTGWGPHSSDYFATRLVAAGPRARTAAPDAGRRAARRRRSTADLAHNDARADGARRDRRRERSQAYEAALPDDGGHGRGRRRSPRDVERFDAAFFTWNGGSNFTDNPEVAVAAPGRRRRGGRTPTSPARSR